jgi:hypothetical protein
MQHALISMDYSTIVTVVALLLCLGSALVSAAAVAFRFSLDEADV